MKKRAPFWPTAVTAVLVVAVAAAVGVVLAGCGGSRGSGQAAAGSAQPARHPWRTQLAAPAMSACRQSVAQATSLPLAARREIAAPCGRIDERVLENEAIVRAVCQELATASSSSPTGRDEARIESRCYAEYASTIPAAARR